MSSVIYGPVSSWRLGKSLGIDLLSTKGKTCCFDCVYCQLGRTLHLLTERRQFVPGERLAEELESVKGLDIDYVTFSGMGEPALASNLGEAIELVKNIKWEVKLGKAAYSFLPINTACRKDYLFYILAWPLSNLRS